MSDPVETSSEPSVKPRDWLSFSSAFVVVAATSILYYAGWLYTSIWYSYYGLDISMINLPPQTILVNGIPSIFVMAFLIMVVVSAIEIVRKADPNYANSKFKIPLFFIITLLIAMVGSLFISMMFSAFALDNWLAGSDITNLRLPILILLVIIMPLALSVILFIPGVFIVEGLPRLFNLKSSEPANFTKEMVEFLDTGGNVPQPLVGTILVVFLFVSIIVSNFLGEFDARRGAHLMGGDWNIPKVYISSTAEIQVLDQIEQNNNDPYSYGPLGLLYSDTSSYYFVDWKVGNFYSAAPKLYVIPRLETYHLQIEPVVTNLKPKETPKPPFTTP